MTTNKEILEEMRRQHMFLIMKIEERTTPWWRRVQWKLQQWMDAYIRRYGKR